MFPHLVKHIDKLEIRKVFVKHITGLQSLDYCDYCLFKNVPRYQEDVRTLLYYLCVKI